MGQTMDKDQIVNDVVNAFKVDDQSLRNVMNLFHDELNKGLSGNNDPRPTVKMLPSFVCGLPSGEETGHFLALDLGGTNFRVLLVTLHGRGKTEVESKSYKIPQNIMHGTATQLFDHVADWMFQFMDDNHISNENLDLGFTFSFPLLQTDLSSGSLIQWTKGFKTAGVEGEDVVQLLREACARNKGMHVNVVAIMNDTIGTLMSLAYVDPLCHIAVVVGTGTNASYLEKMSEIPKLKDLEQTKDDVMVINTEWGGFGDNGVLDFVKTDFDRIIDENSIYPGRQIFEKCIGGMYMGELLRLVLIHLNEKGVIFAGKDVTLLKEKNIINTKHISEVEADALENGSGYPKTRAWLAEIKIVDVEISDCEIIHKVSAAISTRAANLCAACIAVLINRVRKPDVTVGIDGAVYRFHPLFKTLLETKISVLIDPELKFKLKLSEDGSGRGAAIVAAVAKRLTEEKS